MATKSEEEEEATIFVRGLKPTTTDDFIELYFESKKRSGGGPVRKVQPEQHVRLKNRSTAAYVTFKHPTDAANVLKRTHELDGADIEVSRGKPPQIMSDRVLLSNLPESADQDDVRALVENHTGLNAKAILFGEDGDTALVIFERTVDDIENVTDSICGKRLKGHHLSVDCVHHTNVIIVRDVPPDCRPETLEDYFENKKRSGGSDVECVEAFPEDGYALVTFSSAAVASTVAARHHRLNKQDMSVGLYYPFLGASGGIKERSLNLPQPVQVSPDASRKVMLMIKEPKMRSQLESVVQQHHAKLDFKEAKGETWLHCEITKNIPNALGLIKTWTTDINTALNCFLDTFVVREMTSTPEEFQEIVGHMREKARQGNIGVFFQEKEKQIMLIGSNTDKQILDDIMKLVSDFKKKTHRDKNTRKNTVCLSPAVVHLLESSAVLQAVLKDYPEVDVKYDQSGGSITLKGLEHEITAMEDFINEHKDRVRQASHTFDSNLAVRLFGSPAAQQVLKNACLKVDPTGHVDVSETGFTVYSFDGSKASNMKTAGENAIQEKEITLGCEHEKAVCLEQFSKLVSSLEDRNNGMLVIDVHKNAILFIGVNSTFQTDLEKVQDFLKENKTEEKTFPIDYRDYILFKAFLVKQGINLAGGEYDRQSKGMTTTMMKPELEQIQRYMDTFQKHLVTQTEEFTEPSFIKYIQSTAGKAMVKRVETTHRCKVDKIDDAAAKNTSSDQEIKVQKFMEAQQHPRCMDPAPSGNATQEDADAEEEAVAPCKQPRIFVTKMSDITQVEHHFLVNSTNAKLDLTQGQVSSALLKVGGWRIPKECKEKYPEGLRLGEIAVTGPGLSKKRAEEKGVPRLDCKHLLHCCLPQTTDQQQMKTAVAEAVEKCLELADTLLPQYRAKAIGFPALGTGNLEYPGKLVAETMFRTVMKYGNEHPNTKVCDVFFILHKKDQELTEIFAAEERKYHRLNAVADTECYLGSSEPAATGILSHLFFEESRGLVRITFTALSSDDIKKASLDLLEDYQSHLRGVDTNVDLLDRWDYSFVWQTIMTCRAACVDVTFNFSLGKLKLKGHRDDLQKNLLHNIISEADQDVLERTHARLTSWQIQWYWIEVLNEGIFRRPYEERNNYRIEKAYRDGKDIAVVFDQNKRAFQITFDEMTEKPENIEGSDQDGKADVVEVKRLDKIIETAIDAPLPDNWTSMHGKELDLVPLQPDSRDYKRAEDAFLRTILSEVQEDKQLASSRFEIVKIERVQNLTLYKQYCAFKRRMETDFPQHKVIEKSLWHGTNELAVDAIIKYGFDRSYCKDSHKYGQGVYFAKTAHYSSAEKYAAKTSKKERNLLYCKVLVGNVTEGKAGLRILPDGIDSAVDDTDNPTIFIVFKDAQALPEFRVLFKEK